MELSYFDESRSNEVLTSLWRASQCSVGCGSPRGGRRGSAWPGAHMGTVTTVTTHVH